MTCDEMKWKCPKCERQIFSKNKVSFSNHRRVCIDGLDYSEAIRISKIGPLNPNWSKNPSYSAVHLWINRNNLLPNKCQECGSNKNIDLANLSGKYLRDISEWRKLCRRCHMLSDGRMKNLTSYRGA